MTTPLDPPHGSSQGIPDGASLHLSWPNPGPVRVCIAPTLGAQTLPLPTRFSRHHHEDGCGSIRGVDRDDHLHTHMTAASTASRSSHDMEG